MRAQDHAVLDDLEAIGGERGAGGGDVDDQLGGAGGGGAFGGAGAFDDAVVDDAVAGKEAAGEIDVLGRDPQPAVVREAERSRDVVEVGHVAHVDPGLGHCDHDIGVAEAEGVDQHHLGIRRRDHLAYEVLAGDAEMHGAGRKLLGDLGRRQERNLGAVEPRNGTAIIAHAARLDQFKPGAGEEALGVFL